jgi:hypothetical protein
MIKIEACLRNIEVLKDASVTSSIVAHDVVDALQGEALG